jgi:hypothetical protein
MLLWQFCQANIIYVKKNFSISNIMENSTKLMRLQKSLNSSVTADSSRQQSMYEWMSKKKGTAIIPDSE